MASFSLGDVTQNTVQLGQDVAAPLGELECFPAELDVGVALRDGAAVALPHSVFLLELVEAMSPGRFKLNLLAVA